MADLYREGTETMDLEKYLPDIKFLIGSVIKPSVKETIGESGCKYLEGAESYLFEDGISQNISVFIEKVGAKHQELTKVEETEKAKIGLEEYKKEVDFAIDSVITPLTKMIIEKNFPWPVSWGLKSQVDGYSRQMKASLYNEDCKFDAIRQNFIEFLWNVGKRYDGEEPTYTTKS